VYRVCNCIYACNPAPVVSLLPVPSLAAVRMKAIVGAGVAVRVENRVMSSCVLGLVREAGVRMRKGWYVGCGCC